MLRDRRRGGATTGGGAGGYSLLMGADEVGTLATLKAHRREIVDPSITTHRGRIFKTTGDGMLVEFPSVVEAVKCAIEVQQRMTARNTAIAPKGVLNSG